MVRRFLVALALTFVVIFSALQSLNADARYVATATSLAMFQTEVAAQAHCPRDEVVWLNIPSGIYHLKGMRWYGRTKHGAYVCRKDANAARDRETRNGQ